MDILDWQEQAKWLLKSELIRRGVSNEDLVHLLRKIGVEETKASIDSKISRGTFSASFLLQCLNAIGCDTFNSEVPSLNMVEEPGSVYRINKRKKQKNKISSND